MFDRQLVTTKRDKAVCDARALTALAEKENRALTEDEEKAYAAHLRTIEDLGTQISKEQNDRDLMDQLAALAGDDGALMVTRGGAQAKSLGAQFLDSAAGKYLLDTKSARAGSWATPFVELKATLLEDGLIAPQRLPGIAPSVQPPVVMSELFASGTTSSNVIQYMEEQPTSINAAAAVAEGAVKPESTLIFQNKTSKVEKIATWLPVSDEFLEDQPGLRSYIDARLRLFVLLELDDQILNGTGVSPELLGLLVRTDLTPPLAVGTATSLDAIAAQISAVEQASQLPVDGIVLNDADWLKFSLVKTTTGEYIGASPFETPATPTLFGRRVARTPKMPAGTAVVGAFRTGGGQLFQKGGLNVQASNSHSDFFIKNLTALRAELRMALVLLRPVAFGKVTGLNPA
jgi:HK97 family phage major capsid protein